MFFLGNLVKSHGVAVKFCRNDLGDDLLISDGNGRHIVTVPVSLVRAALESEWEADEVSRNARFDVV